MLQRGNSVLVEFWEHPANYFLLRKGAREPRWTVVSILLHFLVRRSFWLFFAVVFSLRTSFVGSWAGWGSDKAVMKKYCFKKQQQQQQCAFLTGQQRWSEMMIVWLSTLLRPGGGVWGVRGVCGESGDTIRSGKIGTKGLYRMVGRHTYKAKIDGQLRLLLR